MRKGVETIVIAAWVREIRRMSSISELGKTRSRRITRERSLIQGDPAAPYLFNMALDFVIRDFVFICKERGWGYSVDGTFIPILVFADNFWLISNSPSHLENMLKVWLECLQTKGWKVPLKECVWCTTAPDELNISIYGDNEQLVRRAAKKEGFKALGAWITFDNKFNVEISYRIQQSWKAVHSHRDLFTNTKASITKRLELLNKVVVPSILWGANSWNPTKKYLQQIRITQNKMIRAMLKLKVQKGEDPGDYVYRVNCKIKSMKEYGEQEHWDQTLMKYHFRFMGHIVRMKLYDNTRLALLVANYKDLEWIRGYEEARGQQGHGRRLHVWRLEAKIWKYFNRKPWKEIARDRQEWTTHLEKFAYLNTA
jgi:hypothetical protein